MTSISQRQSNSSNLPFTSYENKFGRLPLATSQRLGEIINWNKLEKSEERAINLIEEIKRVAGSYFCFNDEGEVVVETRKLNSFYTGALWAETAQKAVLIAKKWIEDAEEFLEEKLSSLEEVRVRVRRLYVWKYQLAQFDQAIMLHDKLLDESSWAKKWWAQQVIKPRQVGKFSLIDTLNDGEDLRADSSAPCRYTTLDEPDRLRKVFLEPYQERLQEIIDKLLIFNLLDKTLL